MSIPTKRSSRQRTKVLRGLSAQPLTSRSPGTEAKSRLCFWRRFAFDACGNHWKKSPDTASERKILLGIGSFAAISIGEVRASPRDLGARFNNNSGRPARPPQKGYRKMSRWRWRVAAHRLTLVPRKDSGFFPQKRPVSHSGGQRL